MAQSPQNTVTQVTAILAARTLTNFKGLREDLHFEAKSASAYDLSSPEGRWELAKDVASFANSEGGMLVIGLKTTPAADAPTDVVVDLDLLPKDAFNGGQITGIVNEYLYPAVKDIAVQWIEDTEQTGRGVLVVRVPEQPHDKRFVLLNRVLDEGKEIRKIVFGLTTRNKSGNEPMTIQQIYLMCQNGRSQHSERLTRIEDKVDHIIGQLDKQTPKSQGPIADASELEARIDRLAKGNE